MTFDDIDFSNLPSDSEAAFILFERQVRKSYAVLERLDRQENIDQNGNYCGSYMPERTYVNTVMAFVDECSLDINLPEMSGTTGYDFYTKFEDFRTKVGYCITRFSLRKNKVGENFPANLIAISSSYKAEIGSLLQTIRKIVNQEITNVQKRDKIFSKIASLQSEVDRDQTTIDALFGRALDLSRILKEFGESLEPLVNKLERLKKIFWEGTYSIEHLPCTEKPELLPQAQKILELEEEIPF